MEDILLFWLDTMASKGLRIVTAIAKGIQEADAEGK